MKVEEVLEDAVGVKPSATEQFEKEKKQAYDLLRFSMQNECCYVYNFEFQDTTVQHNFC